MSLPIIFMYSGQGAQHYQMGKEIYENETVFREAMDACDGIVSPLIGTSLCKIIYGDKRKSEPFVRTLHTHPANVAVGYSLTRLLESKGIRPDYLLGYSLGEYTAAVISGAIGLREGLTFTVNQARLLETRTPAAGMIAVVADPSLMQQRPDLFRSCTLAGHNFASHFVATGESNQLRHIERTLVDEGTTALVLPISHGFHSAMVDPIRGECLRLEIDFVAPTIPVISCMTKGRIGAYSSDHLWQVIRNPIRFYETIQALEKSGPYCYLDAGPAGTMNTFTKYILGRGARSQTLLSMNPFGRDLSSIETLVKTLS